MFILPKISHEIYDDEPPTRLFVYESELILSEEPHKKLQIF